MKNSLMSIADKILLRKRALIETVNDELKNIEQREKSLPLIRITPIQRKAKMTLKMIHLNTSLTDICSLLIIQLIGEKRIPFTNFGSKSNVGGVCRPAGLYEHCPFHGRWH